MFIGITAINTNFSGTNLVDAYFINADLRGADFNGADLRGADFSGADLEDITWNEDTKWKVVRGLETAKNVPEALKKQLGLEGSEEVGESE